MKLPRILRFAALAGVLVFLVAGCGGHSATTSPNVSGSPDTGLTASPSMEGTGPESPQPPASGGGRGGGGVAINLAGMPIGKEGVHGDNFDCIGILWKGNAPPRQDVVTVAGVKVLEGPYTSSGRAPADCPSGPSCAGLRVTAATAANMVCYADITYTGPAQTDPEGTEQEGSLELVGELSCPDAGTAGCTQDRSYLQNSGDTSIPFATLVYPSGSGDSGSSPPDGSPPADGSSPPDDLSSP